MLMPVPKTLTEAINSQPGTILIVGADRTISTVREVPYSEVYRGSTGVRESPAQRLQRMADQDVGIRASR